MFGLRTFAAWRARCARTWRPRRSATRPRAASGGSEMLLTYGRRPGAAVAPDLARPARGGRAAAAPRLLAYATTAVTGVEIHPAARDRPRAVHRPRRGVVIGETAEVGDDVTIYQGVTLGGTGFARGKRHPTVGDEVMIGAGRRLLGPIEVGDRSKIGANSVVIHDVPPNSTVVGNPGHPVRVDGKKPEGPDADWVHLPDPVADAISGLANRLTELEELVAEQTGRKPDGAEVRPLKRRGGPDTPAASRASTARLSSRRCGCGAGAPPCTAAPARGSTAQVSSTRGGTPSRAAISSQACTAQAADLALLLARRQQLAGVDAGGERGVVAQHPVHAQHVGDEVVGEDREPVEVGELGHAGEREVVRHDLGALPEAEVVEEGHPGGEHRGEPLGRAAGLLHQVERATVTEEAAEVAERLGVERHQLVVRLLPEHRGNVGRLQCPQFGGRPRPGGAPAVGERRGHREVARHPGRLRSVGNQPEPKLIASRTSR